MPAGLEDREWKSSVELASFLQEKKKKIDFSV